MQDEFSSLRDKADRCRARIVELEADQATASTETARRRIDGQIRQLRQAEDWFRSRRGYE